MDDTYFQNLKRMELEYHAAWNRQQDAYRAFLHGAKGKTTTDPKVRALFKAFTEAEGVMYFYHSQYTNAKYKQKCRLDGSRETH